MIATIVQANGARRPGITVPGRGHIAVKDGQLSIYGSTDDGTQVHAAYLPSGEWREAWLQYESRPERFDRTTPTTPIAPLPPAGDRAIATSTLADGYFRAEVLGTGISVEAQTEQDAMRVLLEWVRSLES